MVPSGVGVNPAYGPIVRVIGVDAGAVGGTGRSDQSLGQASHGGDHLKDGAGGVHALGGPVQQRLGGVGEQVVVVLRVGGQVVGGIGGQGQHPAAHVHHHRRGAGGVRQPGHEVPQQLLGVGLELAVQGEHHMVARLGLGLPLLAHHRPVLVGLQQPGAAGAVEVGLKGQFHPVLAHIGVHGVVQGLVGGPLLGADEADAAQHMGRRLGVVHPVGGGDNGHPGQAQLFHLGDEGDGHVGGEGVGVVGDLLLAQGHLVEHPQQRSHLGSEGLGLHREGLTHGLHQLLGGNLSGFGTFHPLVLLRQLAQLGGQNVKGAVVVVRPIGKQVLVLGVGPGGLFGDGQGVGPLHPLFLTQLQQLGDHLVDVVAHGGGVQFHGVAQGVGHQHPAVAVQNLPPHPVHRLGLGDVVVGIGPPLGPVHHLQLVQDGEEAQEETAEQDHQKGGAHPQPMTFVLGVGVFVVGVKVDESTHDNSFRVGDKKPSAEFARHGRANKLKSRIFPGHVHGKIHFSARQCGLGSSFDPRVHATGCKSSGKCLHFPDVYS